jgi:hypothetical protein
MAVVDDVGRIADAAAALAAEGERVAGVLVSEPLGRRVYLVAFEVGESRTWLALDDEGRPLSERRLVREAASLAALCEVAEESAAGGDLQHLRARLAEIREAESPEGIEEAEEAAAALAEALQPGPRVASGAYLDALGTAVQRLEQALGEGGGSPFAAALRSAAPAVEELTDDVERNHKLPLR